MRSITVTKAFFYIVAITTGLTVIFSNTLMRILGLQFEMMMCIIVVLMLGLFINAIDVLHQVLVQGNRLNGSLTFLRDSIPYQMEK